jgi:hypothetical protein
MSVGAIEFATGAFGGAPRARRRPSAWPVRTQALGLGAVIAVGYLLWSPTAPDLAAQMAWAHLVHRAGVVPVFARWYEGIGTGSYSLVVPWLMAVLGVRLVGALSALVAVVLSAGVVRDSRQPRLAVAMFAVCNAADLLSGRITFAVGMALGTATVLAMARSRVVTATALAVVTCLASPVAGVLVLVPAAALIVCDTGRRRPAAGAAGGILAALAGLHFAFPLSGYEPFTRELLLVSLAIQLGAAAVPVGRLVRVASLLGAAGVLLAYAVHTPLGGNVARLPVLITPAAVVADVTLRRASVLVIGAILSIYPIAQTASDLTTSRDGTAQLPFTAGLAARLSNDPLAHSQRVEVVDARTHWGASRLADAGISLSRGWLTQADQTDNPLFYGRARLNADTYRDFLDRTATAYVAVEHGAPLDGGAVREAALIDENLPYLSPVWHDPFWTLYAVHDPAPLATGPATVLTTTDTGVVLDAQRAGLVDVDVNWSPFLRVDGGEVYRDGSHIQVQLDSPGVHTIRAAWPWASASPSPGAVVRKPPTGAHDH